MKEERTRGMGHARYTGARIGIREGLDRWGLCGGEEILGGLRMDNVR
jgi:hypothetical protein